MKTLTVDTFENYMDNAPVPANFDKIYEFLQEMIDDNFVVLADDITQNYIQTTPDDDTNGFLTEMRLYADYTSNDSVFIHYRKIIENIDQVFGYFELFFNDQIINTEDWENVTKEFFHQIHIKSNINNQLFEYFLTPANNIYQHIMKEIDKFSHKQDYFIIYPYGENTNETLEIRPDINGYSLMYQYQEHNVSKLINTIDNLQNILIRFLDGNISDFAH